MYKPTKKTILKKLESLGSEDWRAGMTHFGVNNEKAYGVSIPDVRKMAKQIGKNHRFALTLWSTDVHEARILASMIDDPERVTERQMDAWVHEINSWDLCDQCCGNLFCFTKFAHHKALEWSSNKKEYVKRAGFALIAYLAVHDKQAKDIEFIKFFKVIRRESDDDRNFVKKAVNWALRQIGKRNLKLNKLAIRNAEAIKKLNTRSGRWIASDALIELRGSKVKKMLMKKARRGS